MTSGTVRAEFAGTRAKARALANQHPGVTVPNRTSPNGFPFLSVRYTSGTSRRAAVNLLGHMGWAPEFLIAKTTHDAQPRKST